MQPCTSSQRRLAPRHTCGWQPALAGTLERWHPARWTAHCPVAPPLRLPAAAQHAERENLACRECAVQRGPAPEPESWAGVRGQAGWAVGLNVRHCLGSMLGGRQARAVDGFGRPIFSTTSAAGPSMHGAQPSMRRHHLAAPRSPEGLLRIEAVKHDCRRLRLSHDPLQLCCPVGRQLARDCPCCRERCGVVIGGRGAGKRRRKAALLKRGHKVTCAHPGRRRRPLRPDLRLQSSVEEAGQLGVHGASRRSGRGSSGRREHSCTCPVPAAADCRPPSINNNRAARTQPDRTGEMKRTLREAPSPPLPAAMRRWPAASLWCRTDARLHACLLSTTPMPVATPRARHECSRAAGLGSRAGRAAIGSARIFHALFGSCRHWDTRLQAQLAASGLHSTCGHLQNCRLYRSWRSHPTRSIVLRLVTASDHPIGCPCARRKSLRLQALPEAPAAA